MHSINYPQNFTSYTFNTWGRNMRKNTKNVILKMYRIHAEDMAKNKLIEKTEKLHVKIRMMIKLKAFSQRILALNLIFVPVQNGPSIDMSCNTENTFATFFIQTIKNVEFVGDGIFSPTAQPIFVYGISKQNIELQYNLSSF